MRVEGQGFIMPPGKLWHFDRDGGNVNIVIGETPSKYGAVKAIKKPASTSSQEGSNLDLIKV